jgi:hypothetical protein
LLRLWLKVKGAKGRSSSLGVIDGDGYIQARKRLNGYIEFKPPSSGGIPRPACCLAFVFDLRSRRRDEVAGLVITFQNKLNFGTIKRVDNNMSKFVVYNFELKYMLASPAFIFNE